MKYRIALVFALILSLSFLKLEGQAFKKNTLVTGTCYAGTGVRNIYVPPPDEFFRKGNKGGTVIVYYTGFSTPAEAAVEYAVSIIRSILPAGTHMSIRASFERITTAFVLGNSVVSGYAGGWGIDALDPVAYYPIALAEKIAGEQLNNDEDGDLTLRINSTVNWYYGTDGKPGSDSYDLVTVALHEICHGLGFFDSMNVEGNAGYYGMGAIPMIYDKFVTDNLGQKLTDTLKYLNNSSALYSRLVNGPLYFNGPVSGTGNKLYTPSTFDTGSSISHLDESTYYYKSENALMTPYIDRGEAIHNPGPLVRKILGDIGWINTRIIHKPNTDTEAHLSQIQISAQVKSDTAYSKDLVGVVYSFDNFASTNTLYMTQAVAKDNYNVTIGIPSYNTDLQYFIFVKDCFSRVYRSPSLIQYDRYNTYIGADTVKPMIIHDPVKYALQTDASIEINAAVADNIALDSVYMEYRINNGVSSTVGLIHGKGYSYKATFDIRKLNLKGGDSVSYRLFARDSAITANTTVLPKNGYNVCNIEKILSVVDGYSTDFSNSSADFFNTGFTISKPAGFNNYGLHSKHPYESPETDNGSINYTAMFRHPVKIKESGLLISYDEIVLVEPGEDGAAFGSSDFYDYVVLEGSSNFGKTWFSLADGYDSRYFEGWERSYNSQLGENNSSYAGTEDMMRNHMLYLPPDKVKAGDTLLIRFRLFSDPYANGWGWAIENLKLNALVDAVEKIEQIKMSIYPNPGNGIIHLQAEQDGKSRKYSIFNSSGICIVQDILSENSGSIIDLTGYHSGIYFIVVYDGHKTKTFKYTLVK
jgi:hypothetical protein